MHPSAIRLLLALAGLLVLLTAASPLSAQEAVWLWESFPAGYQYRVTCRVELSGALTLPVEKGGRGIGLMNTTWLLVTLNLVGMFPGYLCYGWIADKLGRRRSLAVQHRAGAGAGGGPGELGQHPAGVPRGRPRPGRAPAR